MADSDDKDLEEIIKKAGEDIEKEQNSIEDSEVVKSGGKHALDILAKRKAAAQKKKEL